MLDVGALCELRVCGTSELIGVDVLCKVVHCGNGELLEAEADFFGLEAVKQVVVCVVVELVIR